MLALRPTIAVTRLYDIADEIMLEKVGGLRQRLERTRSGAVKFSRATAAARATTESTLSIAASSAGTL